MENKLGVLDTRILFFKKKLKPGTLIWNIKYKRMAIVIVLEILSNALITNVSGPSHSVFAYLLHRKFITSMLQ